MKVTYIGTVCGHLVYFSHFGMFGPRKIWQPWVTLKLAQLVNCSSPELLALPLCLPRLSEHQEQILLSSNFNQNEFFKKKKRRNIFFFFSSKPFLPLQ
jgi:hypothetical protein